MAKTRRTFTPEEKVQVLRQHLIENVPISDVCDQNGLNPTVFYRWQKEFFENGAAAFERRGNARERTLRAKLGDLEVKLATKDEVIAEIMTSHIQLKKRRKATTTGCLDRRQTASCSLVPSAS